MNLKLISFPICPFVQRAAITLKYKKVDFDIEYIDLKNKPEWFLKISPLGKVPLIIVNEKDIIFESNIINELVDELNAPTTLSKDPVQKAKERAWIAFSDSLMADASGVMRGVEDHENLLNNFVSKLQKLEEVISDQGFFKRDGFSIIDSSYAPIFYRMQYFDNLINNSKIFKLSKVNKWINNLLDQDYVKQSVRDDFETLFKEFVSGVNPNVEFASPVCKI